METDRIAVLTVRAAVRGAIDFRDANPKDPNWWRRTNLIIGELANESVVRTWQALFAHQCSFLASPVLKPEDFKDVQGRARESLTHILNALRPWAAKTVEDTKTAKVEDLITAYKRLIGDPADPEFQKKMRADIEADKKRRAAPPPESDVARIDRLVREKEERAKARQRERKRRR